MMSPDIETAGNRKRISMLKKRVTRAAVAITIAGSSMIMTTGVASADALGSNAPGEVQVCQLFRKMGLLGFFTVNQGQCIKFFRALA